MTKIIMLFLFSIVSIGSALAEHKYVCQEYDRKTNKILEKTLILTKTGPTLDGYFKVPEMQFEASKTPYTLELFNNGLEDYRSMTFKGFSYEEDVMFIFKSDDNKVSFQLYLDEMNEGYFNFKNSIGESDTIYFFCH